MDYHQDENRHVLYHSYPNKDCRIRESEKKNFRNYIALKNLKSTRTRVSPEILLVFHLNKDIVH